MGLRAAAVFGCLIGLTAPAAMAQQAAHTLSLQDQTAYSAAFAAAEMGDAAAFERALAQAQDQVLVTQARARLLASPAAARPYGELRRWLLDHADDPIAGEVRARALKIRPARAPAPPSVAQARWRPDPMAGRGAGRDSAYRQARLDIADGQFDTAEARLRARGAATGPTAFTAGLLAFRSQNYAQAAGDFAAAAAWPHWDPWSAAAAAFWAGRAALAAGDTAAGRRFLEAAASEPTTFYGQLAEESLGLDSPLAFEIAPDDARDAAFLATHAKARRAAAYAQIGRLADAERELLWLHGEIAPAEDLAFLALAQRLAAPMAQLRVAEYGGPQTAAGFCPSAGYAPANGFEIDRALVFAITRQESRFDPQARSRSDARGLMQLLPSTAAWITREPRLRRDPARLSDPSLNMQLGQTYLQMLKAKVEPYGDLAKVVAAYNGGPGWLARWLAEHPQDDPLLMLELMPRPETRVYAERVLSHLALCRKRLRQDTAEMRDLASGRPPVYAPQDRPSAPTLATRGGAG